MKLNTKALALSIAILWGLAVFIVGMANLLWRGMASHFYNFLLRSILVIMPPDPLAI